MRTPRPVSRRGIGTLIGNGWLHESPRNVWPRGWDVRGRSALRKCMFLPVPPGWKDVPLGNPAVAAMQQPARPNKQQDAPLQPHHHDPRKNARLFPAVSPEDVFKKKAALYHDEKAKLLAGALPNAAWFEDPVALGTLLIMFPPIGLAALWSSKRYSNDARWALTVMTALTMCLAAAIVVAIVALRT